MQILSNEIKQYYILYILFLKKLPKQFDIMSKLIKNTILRNIFIII